MENALLIQLYSSDYKKDFQKITIPFSLFDQGLTLLPAKARTDLDLLGIDLRVLKQLSDNGTLPKGELIKIENRNETIVLVVQ